MQQRSPTSRHKIYGGVAASVAVHAVIVAALLVTLPVPETMPPSEESVSVEMVPPEEAPPEPQKEEEQALDLTMPEEKPEEQKAEIPPPPEPPKQEAEEQGAPPQPPAEEQAEATEQAEPPPPPEQSEQQAQEEAPPEAQEQAEAEPPPPPPPAAEPAPEQAEQPQQQMPPSSEQMAEASEQQPAQGQAIPTLRPVFEFGDEDAGPEVTQDGDAAERGGQSESPTDAPDTEAPGEAAEQADTETMTEDATADPAPTDDIAAPEIDGLSGEPLASNDDQPADGSAVAIIPEPKPTPPASEKPAEGEPKPASQPPKEVKRLFSQNDTDDATAMTAMGSIPRDIRASQLCATELREQLRHASPAYQPELLPSYRLPEGTVLDIRQAAFRAGGQWYNIGFRCEIDQNATKVVSFGFDVGDAVPRSQWRARGFPEL